jgi:hypothetical protein
MKLGCSGCLGLVIVLALGSLLVGGAVGAAARMLARPDRSAAATTATDGARAQQKLFDLARHARRGETVSLTEVELNALLARHLVGGRGIRLVGPTATLVGDDRLILDAQSPARQLLDEIALGGLADILPARWQTRPVWLHVGARVRIDGGGPRRQLRMDVDEFAVGRQRLPAPLLRVLLDPATVGLMQWTLPDYVERVDIEPGRVIIRTASPR